MIRGEKIYLGAILRKDLDVLFKWINDRELVYYNSGYNPIHELHHEQWFQDIVQRSDLRIFSIRDMDSDKLIGTCQLCSIHPINRSAELRIRIGEADSRGRGNGTEALRLLVHYGFNDLNLHRIYLYVFETNLQAIRTYEKLRFNREGVLRDADYVNGTFQNVIIMSLLRDDYMSR